MDRALVALASKLGIEVPAMMNPDALLEVIAARLRWAKRKESEDAKVDVADWIPRANVTVSRRGMRLVR